MLLRLWFVYNDNNFSHLGSYDPHSRGPLWVQNQIIGNHTKTLYVLKLRVVPSVAFASLESHDSVRRLQSVGVMLRRWSCVPWLDDILTLSYKRWIFLGLEGPLTNFLVIYCLSLFTFKGFSYALLTWSLWILLLPAR